MKGQFLVHIPFDDDSDDVIFDISTSSRGERRKFKILVEAISDDSIDQGSFLIS